MARKYNKFGANHLNNINRPFSFNELKERVGMKNMTDKELEESAGRMKSIDDDTFVDTFLEGLMDNRFLQLMEFHRTQLLQLAKDEMSKGNDSVNNELFINDFSAPILNSEMWAISMLIRMTLIEGNEEMKNTLISFKSEEANGDMFTLLFGFLQSIRQDNNFLDTLMSLENNIAWDEE